MKVRVTFLGWVALLFAICLPSFGQNWASTSTQVFSAPNATHTGSVDPTTPMHIAVALQMQNSDQVQPMLKRMITSGDPLYGTSLTVAQFAQQFGATSAASAGRNQLPVEPRLQQHQRGSEPAANRS